MSGSDIVGENDRSFVHAGASWHADASMAAEHSVDVVYLYAGYGRIEFVARWVRLGGAVVMKVQLFDDAFEAFERCKDVFEWLAAANGGPVEPDVFVAALREFGFADATERTVPIEYEDYRVRAEPVDSVEVRAGVSSALGGLPAIEVKGTNVQNDRQSYSMVMALSPGAAELLRQRLGEILDRIPYRNLAH